MNASIIPENYEQWQHCIVVECGLALTARFIKERITALEDPKQHYTQQFVRRYGETHHSRVLNWFKRAQSENT